MTTPNERLRTARQKLFASAREAAEALGVPVGTYAGHENGHRGFPASRAPAYARRFKVTEEWLLYGTGMATREGMPTQGIPVIGLASAGSWNEAVQTPKWILPMMAGVAGRDAFAVEVNGDSMDKLLPEGGFAVIDPAQNSLYSGRVYLIENDEFETTIKRYVGDPARFEPVSNNPTHKELNLSDTRYRVIGRVVSYGNTAGL